MTTFDPAWYVDLTATNTNNVTGPVQAYARYGSGLIIWNGLDMDPLSGTSSFDPTSTDPVVQESRIWLLDLLQTFHPDNLPGAVKVFGIGDTAHPAAVRRSRRNGHRHGDVSHPTPGRCDGHLHRHGRAGCR